MAGRRQNTHAEPYSGLSHYEASRHIFTTICIFIVMMACFTGSCNAAKNEFEVPEDTGCACPGNTLVYNCTAVGTGNTLWEGTAFDCPENGIILRHERFASEVVTGDCNSGAIIARSLRVENISYTSQLVVTVSSTLNNKTVQCVHNSGTGINEIGTSRINIFEALYPPPNDINVMFAHRTNITFGWSFLLPNCTSITYKISSDCGSCPESANTNNVTCFDWNLSGDASDCMFTVNSVICGSDGQSSSPVTVSLKVPEAPEVNIFPIYSTSNLRLTYVSVIVNQVIPLNFTTVDDKVFVRNVTSYNVYANSNLLTNMSSCVDNKCEYIIGVPAMTCTTSSNVSVNVSSSNPLGEGQASAPIFIGCINQFVKVEYNANTSTVICNFLNQLGSSEKSCSIIYAQCSQKHAVADSMKASNTSIVLVDIRGYRGIFCVIASNSSFTVIVEGTTESDANESFYLVSIIVPIIVLVAVMTVVSLIVIIVIWLKRRSKYKEFSDQENGGQNELLQFTKVTDGDIEKLKLTPVDQNETILEIYPIESDCSLKEFCTDKSQKGVSFKRGSIFYEFSHDNENISKDKRLIFKAKVDGKYFFPDVNTQTLCDMNLLGKRVQKPSLTDYTVYIQSTGSGARHLAAHTSVLYEKLHPFLRVNKACCQSKKVESDCTLEQFFYKSHSVDRNKCYIYVEKETGPDQHWQLAGSPKEQHQTDVILLDKDTNILLTGANANRMVEQHDGTHVIDIKRWRVYMLTAYRKDLQLKKDTWIILYELQGHHPPLPKNTPGSIIGLCSDQFETEQIKVKMDLKKFKQQHNLDSSECSVYIEVPKVEKGSVLDIILTDEEREQFFSCSLTNEQFLSKSAHVKPWRIFVVKKEMKQLEKNSWVLYRVKKIRWQPNGLMPVYSEHFTRVEVEAGETVDDFCKGHRLNSDQHHIFTELGSLPIDSDDSIRDALLIDNHEENGGLLTGPNARQIAKKKQSMKEGTEDEQKDKWKVFVLTKELKKSKKFKRAASVYHLKHKPAEGKFQVLKVDKDNVRMSDFVKEKLSISRFENEKAFYEVCDEEDLLYYKDVVLLKGEKKLYQSRTKLKCPEEGEVCCDYESFYNISGAPAIGVKPQYKSVTKMFLQSTSYGSRCLKSGALVLYKKN